jgi:serine protease Do
MRTYNALTRRFLAVAIAAALGCSGSETAEAQGRPEAQAQIREQLGSVPAVLDTTTAARLSGAFRGAADRALPAVVAIQATTRARLARGVPRNFPFPLPSPFGGDPQDPQESAPQQQSGTGFVIDNDGHILTNNHVVAGAERVVVRLVDGRTYENARVIGGDRDTDVAVVKIEARTGETLPVSQIGNSDEAKVGDWVLALGNPLGLDFTVTAGIISAKGRSIGILEEQTRLESFIQTDAAINPGNSGGPLVDLLGRVVGINSAIQSETGYFAGAGFAIPINLAMRMANDLIKFGVVHRPKLGVSVRAVTAADAEVYALPSIAGAHVVRVEPRSVAANAGLQVGDVIVNVNGRPVDHRGDISTLLAAFRPGDRVRLAYYRNRVKQEVTVELGEFNVADATRSGRSVTARPAPTVLGFSVAPLSPQLASRYQRQDGVVITEAPRTGPAAESGVRQGYLLLAINGQPIRTTADVDRIARTIKAGEIVSLRVFDPTPEVGETVFNYRARR